MLTWLANCIIATFETTDQKLQVSLVTLLIQNNKKLIQQLKSGFKKTINKNKYEPKVTKQT